MSLLITSTTVQQSAEKIIDNGYFQKLNVTTIKGKTSCKTKKDLLNFMIMQVVEVEEIPITTGDCNCLKDEFEFTQTCEDAS